jgi:hypothetical protein
MLGCFDCGDVPADVLQEGPKISVFSAKPPPIGSPILLVIPVPFGLHCEQQMLVDLWEVGAHYLNGDAFEVDDFYSTGRGGQITPISVIKNVPFETFAFS